MNHKNETEVKFGKNVRKARESKGLSQEILAFECGLHRTYIGMVERSERNITLVNADKIANALKISVSELLK